MSSKVTTTGQGGKAEGKTPTVSHSFARQDADQKTIVPVLRRVGRQLQSGLRAVLEPVAGGRIKVDALEPEFSTFDSWQDSQPELVSISMLQVQPMKGRALMKMDPLMIGAMVDAFFGGAIREVATAKKEFSQADLRLVNRIGQSIAERLGEAWSDLGPFASAVTGHATTMVGVRLIAGSARIITQRFRLGFTDAIRFELEFVYPVEMLQSVDHLLELNGQAGDASDPIWRDKMTAALANVHMPARSVLARPTLTLPQLAELKVGDVIPIPPARNLPLLIGDRVFARGSLGEQNGLAAFRIEHIEKGPAR